MAALSGGYADTRFVPDVEVPLPGLTTGLNWPPAVNFEVEFASMATLVVPMIFGDDLAAGSPTPPPAPAKNDLGEAHTWDAATIGLDWFEAIHILPREKVEFGNIIAQVDEDYEIFSAYRDSDHTITTITNNAAPGVELPGVAAPELIKPLRSLLNGTSTFNHQLTTGLGTLVQTVVRATREGLPKFDSNIVFSVTSNDVELLVSGSRIVLIPQEYEAPVKETLSFLTDIIDALDGKEQRLALRSNPRQLFDVLYLLDENARQRMQVQLMDWMDNSFGFPLQHEVLKLTAAHSAATTTYSVSGADDVDLRIEGLAVVITDANTFDVISITALTDTLITADDPSINAYPVGTSIMPLRVAVIQGAVPGKMLKNNLQEFRIRFEVTDNDTGALAGSTTPGFWSIYNSRVLFDDSNVVTGMMSERYVRRIFRIDNKTGVITQSSPWEKYKRSHQKGFVAHSRAEIKELRQVLIGLNGKQKSFYIPTFIKDVDVKASLGIGTSTMDITKIGYVRFAQDREPKTIMRITFNNGDPQLVRIVQSSAEIDTTTERLTLDTTWPSTVAASEVDRVEFYELVRFDTDEFLLSYPRIGLAELVASVKAVFD